MTIGVILSQVPGYSETFFNSKISGLQENGYTVVLFTGATRENYIGCIHKKHPKVYKFLLIQIFMICIVGFQLLPHLRTVRKYIKLELAHGISIKRLIEKIYLNSELLKFKGDWLHYGFATLALERELVAKAIGTKMAVSFRGFDMVVYPVKNPGCYHVLWKYVDKVHTISDYLLRLAREHGLPENMSYKKITPAVNVNAFQSIEFNFDPSTKLVFLSTARLHWIKGLVHTIEALSILKDKGFDFTYKIIGEGKEYERIAFAAYQLGLKNEVEFLGKLPHEEVKRELENATIYLQYSIQEGFCNAVLEAQAVGKLCVVSNAEGLSENVLHKKTGWVVPKCSPHLLAEQIRNVLLMDDEIKSIISQNAIERVRREFSLKKQIQEFLEFYRENGNHEEIESTKRNFSSESLK